MSESHQDEQEPPLATRLGVNAVVFGYRVLLGAAIVVLVWVSWGRFTAQRPAPVIDDNKPGFILIWDPVICDASGKPTGELRVLPKGWKVMDGTDGTIDLSSGAVTFIQQVGDAPIPDGATWPGEQKPK